MKGDESIVVGKGAELTNVNEKVRVNREGCLSCLHGSLGVPCHNVTFNSQIMWV